MAPEGLTWKEVARFPNNELWEGQPHLFPPGGVSLIQILSSLFISKKNSSHRKDTGVFSSDLRPLPSVAIVGEISRGEFYRVAVGQAEPALAVRRQWAGFGFLCEYAENLTLH